MGILLFSSTLIFLTSIRPTEAIETTVDSSAETIENPSSNLEDLESSEKINKASPAESSLDESLKTTPEDQIEHSTRETIQSPSLEPPQIETSQKNATLPDETSAQITEEPQREVLEPSLSVTLEDFLEPGHFDSVIVEQGIERSDRIASYLLLQAKEALREDKVEEAINLGQMASKISPLSPSPSFFLAEAIWRTKRFHFIEFATHYLTGISLIFGDFLFLLSILSPLFLLFLLSIFLSMVAFIFYSLFSYAPIWVHHMVETSRGYLQPIPAGLLFTVLFLTPFFLGLPILWFFLFSFILFWGFYSNAEKWLVYVFIIGVGTMPWVLPFLLTLFTANASPILNEMSRNNHSDYFWTPPALEVSGSGWEGWFIHASYEAQIGKHEKAAEYYKKALEENPNSPMILNNLGNLAFYSNEYPQAIEYYQEAIKVSPVMVAAYYNLGQTYREMLLFEKGETLFIKARAINTKAAENYAMKSEHYPDFPVIEARFTKADLWKKFLGEKGEDTDLSENLWQGVVGAFPLKSAPWVGGAWIISLALSGGVHSYFFSAKQCTFCKKAVCKRCVRRLFSYQVCRPCEMRFITVRRKSDFTLIEDAVKKVPRRLYPMFFLPGGGHLAIQKTKTGFILLSFFFLSICAIFFRDLVVPPTEWYLHDTGAFLPLIALVTLYFGAFVDLLLKRSTHKWL